MSYADEVLADAPVLYYRLGETVGTTAGDETGNDNDGTYGGSPQLGVTGLVDDADTAVFFNEGETGVGTDYCESPTLPSSTWTGFSVEIVLRPIDAEGYTENQHVVYGPHPIFQDRNNLKITTVTTPPSFTFGFYDLGAAQASVTTPPLIVDGDIYHVLFTIEDSGFARIYVCGELQDEYEMVGAFDMQDGKWVIARTDDTAVEARYRGVADEFALYDYALSEARALVHCAAMVPAAPTETCYLIESDQVLFIDATEGDKDVLLLDSMSLPIPSRIYYIKRIDASMNTVTINGNGTLIDDVSSFSLEPFDAVALISDGVQWHRL